MQEKKLIKIQGVNNVEAVFSTQDGFSLCVQASKENYPEIAALIAKQGRSIEIFFGADPDQVSPPSPVPAPTKGGTKIPPIATKERKEQGETSPTKQSPPQAQATAESKPIKTGDLTCSKCGDPTTADTAQLISGAVVCNDCIEGAIDVAAANTASAESAPISPADLPEGPLSVTVYYCGAVSCGEELPASSTYWGRLTKTGRVLSFCKSCRDALISLGGAVKCEPPVKYGEHYNNPVTEEEQPEGAALAPPPPPIPSATETDQGKMTKEQLKEAGLPFKDIRCGICDRLTPRQGHRKMDEKGENGRWTMCAECYNKTQTPAQDPAGENSPAPPPPPVVSPGPPVSGPPPPEPTVCSACDKELQSRDFYIEKDLFCIDCYKATTREIEAMGGEAPVEVEAHVEEEPVKLGLPSSDIAKGRCDGCGETHARTADYATINDDAEDYPKACEQCAVDFGLGCDVCGIFLFALKEQGVSLANLGREKVCSRCRPDLFE